LTYSALAMAHARRRSTQVHFSTPLDIILGCIG